MTFTPTNYTKVASFLKPQGTNGELKIEIDEVYWDDVMRNDHLFVQKNGAFLPYFIESFREHNHILVKLEEVDSPEEAAGFSLKAAFLRSKDIKSKTALDTKEKMGWEGYSIIHEGQNIGQISEIVAYPSQIMAFVNVSDTSFMIPLVDEWITNVDEDHRQIMMALPDGLLAM